MRSPKATRNSSEDHQLDAAPNKYKRILFTSRLKKMPHKNNSNPNH